MKSNTYTAQGAWNEGEKAGRANKEYADNPYARGTTDADNWDNGFAYGLSRRKEIMTKPTDIV